MDSNDIVDFETLDETTKNLLRQSVEARTRAYCPYSKFAVGSAILTEKDEKIYTGCNIENVAFTPGICAERAAVAKAVSDGYLKLKTVTVIAFQANCFTAPCGVCRQFLMEFRGSNGDIDVFISKPDLTKVLCTKLSKLLPLSFVNFEDDLPMPADNCSCFS